MSKKFRKTYISILIVLFILIAGVGFLWRNHWLRTTPEREKVENTVNKEIGELAVNLSTLGFKDLHNLNTDCGNKTYTDNPLADQAHGSKTYFECSSGIDRYVVLPADKQALETLNKNAVSLDATLRKNGWTSRPDLLTVPWFKKISEGVDYQPDQLNTKTVGRYQCSVDFFTAFSKPKPAAISVRVFCYLPNPDETPIGL